MPLIIRKGDTSDHGGEVTGSSADFKAEGKFVARVGDAFSCPIHGATTIAEGSSKLLNNGKKVARHGHKTACGASLVSSATKTEID